MSVIPYTAAEIKALEVAVSRLIPLERMVNPFPALYVANADAYSRSYDERRPLTEGEQAEHVSEYEQAQPHPHPREDLCAADVLAMLHSLTYNCLTNGGTYTVSPQAEEARRAVVQSVVFECLTPNGRPVKLGEFAYIRRLSDGEDLSMRIQLLTTDNPQQPYQCQDEDVNKMAAQYHGRVFRDGEIPFAFKLAWAVNDLCGVQADAEYETALRAEAVKRGITTG